MENEIHLKWWDGYDQPKLHVRIMQSFNITAHYYGWAGSQSSCWKSCNIQGQTFLQTFHEIESWPRCRGIGNIANDIPHYCTKAADLSSSEPMPVVSLITYRYAMLMFIKRIQCYFLY